MTYKFQATNASRLRIISKVDERPDYYRIWRNIFNDLSAIDALGFVYNSSLKELSSKYLRENL